MSDTEKKRDDIGAMWRQESQKGGKYLSGMITIDGQEHRFVAFPNRKAKENQPDYRIYPSTPREKPAPRQTQTSSRRDHDNDDVPF